MPPQVTVYDPDTNQLLTVTSSGIVTVSEPTSMWDWMTGAVNTPQSMPNPSISPLVMLLLLAIIISEA